MIKSIRKSTTVAALLIAAASVDNVAVNAITAKPSWTVPSTVLIQQGQRGGKTAAGRVADDSSVSSSFGDLCVDDEGNLYCPSSSSSTSKLVATSVAIRGGALCVDNEGNFYSPRIADPQEQTEVRGGCNKGEASLKKNGKDKIRRGLFRRLPQDKQDDESSSAATASIITGGYIRSDRLGGLCVDGDGNFCSVPSSAIIDVPRGGALRVDDEGNLYSDCESRRRSRSLRMLQRRAAVSPTTAATKKHHKPNDEREKKRIDSRRRHPPHDGR
jgi:hypothetical protein